MLFLTPYPPAPVTSGGAARVNGIMAQIATVHRVAYLPFARNAQQQRRRGLQLASLVTPYSYERLTYRRRSYQRAVDRACEAFRPDVVVIAFAQMGYVTAPIGIPVILDAHNVEHELQRHMATLEGPKLRRVYAAVNARKLQREETALARRVDAITVTSESDAQTFRRLAPGCRVIVIPNGVATDRFTPPAVAPEHPALLYFGTLDYYPNRDAVRWFNRIVWPGLRNAYPGLNWRIVGRHPPPDIQNAPGVDVVGEVDDIRAELARASVVIVPLRAGGGTRLKVLEAMAMAVPVVSTSIGVEGLDVTDGVNVLLADSPTAFSRAVAILLDSPATHWTIGNASRQLVTDRYDWRHIAADFDALLAAIAPA